MFNVESPTPVPSPRRGRGSAVTRTAPRAGAAATPSADGVTATPGFGGWASQITFPQLLCQVVRSAPGHGEDGQGVVLFAGGGERRAVHHEDVPHLVHLVPGVEG